MKKIIVLFYPYFPTGSGIGASGNQHRPSCNGAQIYETSLFMLIICSVLKIFGWVSWLVFKETLSYWKLYTIGNQIFKGNGPLFFSDTVLFRPIIFLQKCNSSHTFIFYYRTNDIYKTPIWTKWYKNNLNKQRVFTNLPENESVFIVRQYLEIKMPLIVENTLWK